MRDPVVGLGLILLFISGLVYALADRWFYKRLSSTDPEQLRRVFDTDVRGLRSLGLRQVLQIIRTRRYARLAQRSTVFIGDLWRIAISAFTLVFVLFFASFLVRFVIISVHNTRGH